MTQFTHPEIWKQHAVLLAIHARSSNAMISDCLGISLRTVQRIQKDLDEFNDDYKGAAAQKRWVSSMVIMKVQQLGNFTLILLIKIHKFVSEIQAMFNSKSIRSIIRDMGMFEFLIRQVVYEDIWYFSKMRKG